MGGEEKRRVPQDAGLKPRRYGEKFERHAQYAGGAMGIAGRGQFESRLKILDGRLSGRACWWGEQFAGRGYVLFPHHNLEAFTGPR